MERNQSVRIDPLNFQKSISNELRDIQDRVRNLIGSAHWDSDGTYKEAILKNVLKRFLPANLGIGTGFIVKKFGNNAIVSPQIDIIIYDKTYPLLFSEGDFIIVTQKNVRGILEVKTTLDQSNLRKVISDANRMSDFIDPPIFYGIFAYKNACGLHDNSVFRELIIESNGIINHLSLGEDIFIKFWHKDRPHPDTDCGDKSFYSIYQLNGLSFSYFISNLLECAVPRNLEERFWVLYPLPDGKESKKICDVCLKNSN